MGTERFFSQEHRAYLLCKDEICAVYKMKNDTGDGTMTIYDLLPGVALIFNDFHMKSSPSREKTGTMLEIHHCLEGRIECETEGGAYLYLSPGDLLVDSYNRKNKMSSFPLCHYHGITMTICMEELTEETAEILSRFSLDLDGLFERYRTKSQPFVMRVETRIEQLFAELYDTPENLRATLYRTKALELLAQLEIVNVSDAKQERPYFYRTQVEKVKAIMTLMTAHPEKHYTIKELSALYDISESALKSCFKGVYGVAVYTYMRNYRMDMAAQLLVQTERPITEIAGAVGFTNSSKFSEAFKAVKGHTPMDFRKQII